MKVKFILVAALLVCVFWGYFYSVAAANGMSGFDLSIQLRGVDIHCRIDEKPVDAKMSSDGEVVIVSGTGYIPVSELSGCQSSKIIHVKKAALHVGFLSDINLKTGIYASMVPVSVSPLSFVAVVAKLGNDTNLIKKPGFYRKGVGESKLEEEASSSMKPVISLDGRYLSVDVQQCGTDQSVEVFEIKSGKTRTIGNQACNSLFNFQ